MRKLYFLPVMITQWIIRLVTRGIFLLFCDLEVRGLENLKEVKAPVIFAANHASEWDGPLIPVPMRLSPMIYIGMEKKFYRTKRFGLRGLFYGSSLFKLVGAYPVYYGLKDYEKSLVHHIDFIRKNFCVTIFPEGRCSKDGTLGEFKAGVIALAHITGAPILPVYIKNTHHMKFSTFLHRKRKVAIVFGTPYQINIPERLSSGELIVTYKKEATQLRGKIINLSH